MRKVVKKSKPKRGYCFIHKIKLYSTNLILYYGNPKDCLSIVKKSIKKLKKNVRDEVVDFLVRYIGGPDNTSPYFCTQLNVSDAEWIFIHVGDDECITNTEQLGTLLHECLHAAIYIARTRGIRDDNFGHEALVYLTEYIFTYFLDKIKKSLYKKHKLK